MSYGAEENCVDPNSGEVTSKENNSSSLPSNCDVPVNLSTTATQQIQKLIDKVEMSRSDAWLRLSQIRLDAYQRERSRQRKLEEMKDKVPLIDPYLLPFESEINWAKDEDKFKAFKKKIDEKLAIAHVLLNKLGSVRNSVEESYVTEIKDQAIDLEKMRREMEIEKLKQQKLQEMECSELDNFFAYNKDGVIHRQRIELDSLLDMKSSVIASNNKEKENLETTTQEAKVIVEIKKKHEYNKMKEKFENEIEELDSMLVTKKTKYQFDRDQLNYQCIMLQKKHADSENVFQKCKRKRDKVERKLKEKREEFDVKSLKNDKELALIQKEAAASLKRFKEIQSKKDYFDNFDKERYQSIWKMHKEDLDNLRRNIISKSQSIYTNILGRFVHLLKIRRSDISFTF